MEFLSQRMLPKLIVIVGPTASGKTRFAIKLARSYNGEIVSADSRQVYTGMDIGTAKIKGRLSAKGYYRAEGVPHHLIDVVSPGRAFTVAHFKRRALNAIRGIIARGRLPILVGGTGLYVRAIVDDLYLPKAPPNSMLRTRLERLTTNELCRRLCALDAAGAARIDHHNRRRLIRAIEIVMRTGAPLIAHQRRGPGLFDVLTIGIRVPRLALYRRIDRRVAAQMRAGLVREVKQLIKKYGKECAALTGIGYREIIAYLDGRMTLREAVERIKYNTHAYARRQMTWFKRDPRIVWVQNVREARGYVQQHLKVGNIKVGNA